MFPSRWRDSDTFDTFANLSAAYNTKSDMRVLNILDLEDCDPVCTQPLLKHPELDGIFLYYGSAYVGGEGRITWTEGKVRDVPVTLRSGNESDLFDRL